MPDIDYVNTSVFPKPRRLTIGTRDGSTFYRPSIAPICTYDPPLSFEKPHHAINQDDSIESLSIKTSLSNLYQSKLLYRIAINENVSIKSRKGSRTTEATNEPGHSQKMRAIKFEPWMLMKRRAKKEGCDNG
jgi:hypothetical protein